MAEHEITSLIRSVTALTGVGICFYDTEKYFHYDQSGNREYMGHYCDFCRFARELPGGRYACDKSDREEAFRLAAAHKAPFFHRCHMGLCELVVPVFQRSQLVGLIFVGQCRSPGEEEEREIAARAKVMGGDPEIFLSLYRNLPEIKQEHLMAMGQLLHLYFSRLGNDREFFAPADPTDGQLSVAKRICRYLDANYFQPVSLTELGERFFLHPSYLARTFRREIGQTVGEYLRSVRHAHACRLLQNPELSVSSVALNVGYADTNYFCRVFRTVEGLSPTEYRQKGLSHK